MSAYVDDRTDEQRKTHLLAVVGTDPGMSGWCEAEDGARPRMVRPMRGGPVRMTNGNDASTWFSVEAI